MKEKAESLVVLLLDSSTNMEVEMNVMDDKHVQAYGRHAATSRLFLTRWSYQVQYYVIFVRTVPHEPHGIIRLPVAPPRTSATRDRRIATS